MRPLLFSRVLGLETRKLMSYRGDFWLHAVIGFAVEVAIAYFLWRAVFEATGRDRIGGFSFEQMVAYYLLAILAGRLVRGQERQISVAQDIYEGTLTRYLIYPAPYFGFKYAEHLGALLPAALQAAIFGGAAALLFEVPAGFEVSAGSLARAAVAVTMGNLLAFLLRFPLLAVAFWADNVWSLNVMLRFVSELLGGLMLPLALFPFAVRQGLELLPFAYLFSFPVLTLLGQVTPLEWARGLAVAVLWCAVLGLVSLAVWRRGCRTYTGVGI